MIRSLLLALVLAAVGGTSPMASAAHAQAAQAGTPSDAQRARARQLYAEGQRHFEAGRFAEAQASFEAAYAEVPNPVVLLGVASAQERLGRAEDAARTLRRYLRERPDAPDRESVQERIARLDPGGVTADPGVIRVASTPEGAAIAIDGQPTDRTTPAEVQVAPGAHEVTLTLQGYAPLTQTVRVDPGQTSDLTLGLVALEPESGIAGQTEQDVFGDAGAGEAPAQPASSDAPAPANASPSAGVWAATAVAGVGLVTGTVFGFLALSAQSDFDVAPSHEVANRGEAFALVADLAFGVAVAAGLTGIVLYATEQPGSSAAEDRESAGGTAGEHGGDAASNPHDENADGEGEPDAGSRTSQRPEPSRVVLAPWVAPTGIGGALQSTF